MSGKTIGTLILIAVIGVAGGVATAYFLRSSSEGGGNAPNYEAVATVSRVDDGDTIGVNITEVTVLHDGVSEGEDTIRFAGIDTEETGLNSHATYLHSELEGVSESEYKQTEYYQHAMSAKSLVENLCSGLTVYLDIDDQAEGHGPYHNSTVAISTVGITMG
ncbi:hypothetical protein AKJ48_00915 [candidate division MSBL1 archaeon SCGC-AAA261O19]|uniref:Uncharacterized protein n=1 Tax=candidate division MSBL1 archaeon SCGC-AAA261O19 TaxID=1698277 RepID=A0A133VET7_9EURY|nr:hypothetical protein AKJ48_00915 [candidate division MSBL1 archaeon SCGC-AAA261O19]